MNSWNSSINELQKKLEKAEKESTVQKDTMTQQQLAVDAAKVEQKAAEAKLRPMCGTVTAPLSTVSVRFNTRA